MMIDLPQGMATSIGSLPYQDPQEAVDVVLEYHPDLPAAPTLPRRSPLESMLGQVALGISGVSITDEGELEIDDPLDPDAPIVTEFPDEAFAGLLAFVDRLAGRTDPVKVQLTGPTTLGLALVRAGAVPATAFSVASAAVRQRARAMLDLVEAAMPDAPIVMFFDEPSLTGCDDDAFPLPPDATTDLLSGALAAVDGRAASGVHCCGPTNWSAVIDAGPDIISVPLDAGIELVPGALARFLDRGGWVAWGAVPTHRPVGTLGRILWKRLTETWRELVESGCDPDQLIAQAMITPDCGLASHGTSQTERTLRLSMKLAERLSEDDSIAIRISS